MRSQSFLPEVARRQGCRTGTGWDHRRRPPALAPSFASLSRVSIPVLAPSQSFLPEVGLLEGAGSLRNSFWTFQSLLRVGSHCRHHPVADRGLATNAQPL